MSINLAPHVSSSGQSQSPINQNTMDSPKDTKTPLADRILQCGVLAFDPELSKQERRPNEERWNWLMESNSTLALLPALNFLIQPGRVQLWLRAPLLSVLATLPLRERGVQDTIEFVLSVHPSNSHYDGTGGSGKGSLISPEALNAASKLLSSPPGLWTPEKWFPRIAPQLLSLLQGEGEPEMDKAAAFIIGFGILGRKQYGAPGKPGWKAFAEPVLRCIDPTIVPTGSPSRMPMSGTEEPILTLSTANIIATSLEVSQSLKKLTTLVTSHPHPSLTKRLLGPLLLPLWSLSCWPKESELIESYYRKPARRLLKTLLQLSSSNESAEKSKQGSVSTNLSIIVRNLMFKGRLQSTSPKWMYATSSDGGIQIQESISIENQAIPGLAAVDGAASFFVDLVKSIPDLDTEVSSLFMNLCTKWLKAADKTPTILVTGRLDSGSDNSDVETRLIEAKVLQKMLTAFPEKLVSDSRQVLDLVNQVLSQYTTTTDGGDEGIVAVALSLLNIVLTSPSFREAPDQESVIKNIELSLQVIDKNTHLDISSTARNLLMLMRFRNIIEEPGTPSSQSPSDERTEDRKSYSLAMSYLTASDSPPPVRVQGLEIISSLIRANSPILDIPALLILFSSLLQDGEEYIYLRAIKSFIQLSDKHPKAVMADLIDRYADPNEEYEIDQRLRLGEALLQVIQSSSNAFIGEIASLVCQGLLSVAGRRGVRLKTEEAQEKRASLRRKKDKEAEDAWDGLVPQLDEAMEDGSQEDIELMAQIVTGWESRRGTEDVRIRASAVSILASAIESNIAGIGSNIISTIVDLSIHILTLEPEPEKGIIRRSAIILIMSFVRALDSARADGRKLGFGFVGQSLDDVQRILKYVEDTDNDGLVRQHARDVVESLQAWQINMLLPSQSGQMEIEELAGLTINPRNGKESTSSMRPRIEEID